MKVQELERFGAKLPMPKEAVREQNKIMLRAVGSYRTYRRERSSQFTNIL